MTGITAHFFFDTRKQDYDICQENGKIHRSRTMCPGIFTCYRSYLIFIFFTFLAILSSHTLKILQFREGENIAIDWAVNFDLFLGYESIIDVFLPLEPGQQQRKQLRAV